MPPRTIWAGRDRSLKRTGINSKSSLPEGVSTLSEARSAVCGFMGLRSPMKLGSTPAAVRSVSLRTAWCDGSPMVDRAMTQLPRLSVLDQSPVSQGSTAAEALRNTLDLARLTDRLGYHRYWVAEHHGGPMLAGPSPEALIGPIASATERIRVGSGGVMLPHDSPLKGPESFMVLGALFPGGILLGLGRA